MIRLSFFIVLIFAPVSELLANADDIDKLNNMLINKEINEKQHSEAILAGEERAFVCKYCHGKDGNSKRNYIPNLAGQNARYLLLQFEKFANGARKDRIMSELSKNLTADDRVNIALFYSSKKVKLKTPYKPELMEKGKNIYEAKCAQCHDISGHGRDELPRLAGQPAEYVIKTLTRYKTLKDFRAGTPMQAMTQDLSDDGISSLAAYISALK